MKSLTWSKRFSQPAASQLAAEAAKDDRAQLCTCNDQSGDVLIDNRASCRPSSQVGSVGFHARVCRIRNHDDARAAQTEREREKASQRMSDRECFAVRRNNQNDRNVLTAMRHASLTANSPTAAIASLYAVSHTIKKHQSWRARPDEPTDVLRDYL